MYFDVTPMRITVHIANVSHNLWSLVVKRLRKQSEAMEHTLSILSLLLKERNEGERNYDKVYVCVYVLVCMCLRVCACK